MYCLVFATYNEAEPIMETTPVKPQLKYKQAPLSAERYLFHLLFSRLLDCHCLTNYRVFVHRLNHLPLDQHPLT